MRCVAQHCVESLYNRKLSQEQFIVGPARYPPGTTLCSALIFILRLCYFIYSFVPHIYADRFESNRLNGSTDQFASWVYVEHWIKPFRTYCLRWILLYLNRQKWNYFGYFCSSLDCYALQLTTTSLWLTMWVSSRNDYQMHLFTFHTTNKLYYRPFHTYCALTARVREFLVTGQFTLSGIALVLAQAEAALWTHLRQKNSRLEVEKKEFRLTLM